MPDDAANALTTLLVPLAELMSAASDADPQGATPCSKWVLADLTAHIAGTTTNFAIAAEGGQPDWSSPPDVGYDAASAFDQAAKRLASAATGAPAPIADMACAELAVHTWDLARALGRDSVGLPTAAAERGLTFMRAGLDAAGRGEFFAPEHAAPPNADAFTAIAAFAGRSV